MYPGPAGMRADFRSGKPLKIGKNVRSLDILYPHPHGHLPPPLPLYHQEVIHKISTAYPQLIHWPEMTYPQVIHKVLTILKSLTTFFFLNLLND